VEQLVAVEVLVLLETLDLAAAVVLAAQVCTHKQLQTQKHQIMEPLVYTVVAVEDKVFIHQVTHLAVAQVALV
jgi:hypothetical protein